jgi:hypothetical protein
MFFFHVQALVGTFPFGCCALVADVEMASIVQRGSIVLHLVLPGKYVVDIQHYHRSVAVAGYRNRWKRRRRKSITRLVIQLMLIGCGRSIGLIKP